MVSTIYVPPKPSCNLYVIGIHLIIHKFLRKVPPFYLTDVVFVEYSNGGKCWAIACSSDGSIGLETSGWRVAIVNNARLFLLLCYKKILILFPYCWRLHKCKGSPACCKTFMVILTIVELEWFWKRSYESRKVVIVMATGLFKLAQKVDMAVYDPIYPRVGNLQEMISLFSA